MVRLWRSLSRISLIVVVGAAILVGLDVFASSQSFGVELALVVVTMTVSGLCFAVGVIGLVVAGSRRHWGWFIGILLPLILVNYGPRLFFIDSQLNAAFYIFGAQGFDLVVFILMDVLPAVIPILALTYCHFIERVPESSRVADDSLELEYSPLSSFDDLRQSGN